MIKNDKKKDKRYIITISIRKDVRYCNPTIDAVKFQAYLRIKMVIKDLFILFFFTILYHLLDCKTVYDWFWMIYGIAENPRPTGKCVK